MPENHNLSRYDHLKAIFSRRPSQDSDSGMKDDSRSEITLVSGQTFAAPQKKRQVPQNYNRKYRPWDQPEIAMSETANEWVFCSG
ncbi:unnamed protein product [Penicillium salamii]|nr:unnamed protein product [Penicillium salamii]